MQDYHEIEGVGILNNGKLHLINASLPLEGGEGLFELKAEEGRWISITPQDEVISFTDHFHSLDALMNGTLNRDGLNCFNLEGKLLLPGFVDSHLHMDKAFSAKDVPNVSGTLIEACQNYGAVSSIFTKETIKKRIYKSAIRALSYGTTRMRTHLDFNSNKEVYLRTILAALEVKQELRDQIDIQLFPMYPINLSSTDAAKIYEEAFLLGMDGVGGAPHLSATPEIEIDEIFELAARLDKPVDLHTDESDDPAKETVSYIADKTVQYSYQGRVTVGHLCSLSPMEHERAERFIRKMADAKLGAVTLPAPNLYLQGREDRGLIRRGTTRIKELLEAGIPLAAASDNIQDTFHPYGRGDLIQIGLLTAYAAQFGSTAELNTLLRMITEIPAKLLHITDYGIRLGVPADFVIVDAQSNIEMFAEVPVSRWVYKNSRWIYAAAHSEIWDERLPFQKNLQ
jgi:cytosine deaminase